VPTGVAVQDARERLLAAAERILVRDGPSGLTSRSVTAEAGVAKGVLHRHFTDVDELLVELVHRRGGRLARQADELRAAAGTATVVENLVGALIELFDPIVLAMVGLVTSRDALRARLRRTTPTGVPLLTEAAAMISAYLAAERDLGRITRRTEVDALAFTVIGAGHLLFVGDPGASPSVDAVREVVASIVSGAEPGRRP
jgi:AcrR family transcriptional regulator